MKLSRGLCLLSLLFLATGLLHTNATAQTKLRMDSLLTTAASPTEHSLQFLLDSLGYDIDVANDELGTEVFCGIPGVNMATMVIEVAGSSVYATSGYYEAGDTSVFYQLFGPTNVPGDSVNFSLSGMDQVGFYMKPNLPGEENTWLTEHNLNWDGFDHAWVFSTGAPHEFLICFEDLPNGGDADYQDLVIKVRFHNRVPTITFVGDTSVVLCGSEQVCFDIEALDENCPGDSLWLSMLSGEGSFSTQIGVGSISVTHCFTPSGSGTYEFVYEVVDELGATTVDTMTIQVELASAPTVTLHDTTLFQCDLEEICLPVTIFDADCDVVSVTSNVGSYSGTVYNFDQVSRINDIGGTVTQIGGGDPGKVLYTASDFVPPVNSQSGVGVTLPNFVFASQVISGGSFPVALGPANAAAQMLGSPTDMTYTLSGPGGPDGGYGDGSVDFSYGNYSCLGFSQDATTCSGANIDLVIFTNTCNNGTAKLILKNDGIDVYTTNQSIAGAASGSGMGGVTIDLPDGITFDALYIRCIGGSFSVDAVAARTAPSPTATDLCFTPSGSGTHEVTVTATDNCGNVGTATAWVTVNLNQPPVADAGTDQTIFACDFSQICFPVSFTDPDDNLTVTELCSGPGVLSGNQVCFTPASEGTYTFIIRAVDECGLEDRDTVLISVEKNSPPVAASPSTVNQFLCTSGQLCHTFTATDPDGGSLSWTLLSGPGAITAAGEYCFTPTVSGCYTAQVAVADSCGAADTTSITYNITVNSAPVANDPASPVTVSQCAPEEICYVFTATDANGGTLTWTLNSGPGSLSTAGEWCFTPTTSGSYTADVTVTDACGATDVTSLTYNVTVNEPPTVALGADYSVNLCDPEPICVDYTIADPQGLNGLVETMVSGYGSIDTAQNKVCFTPTTAGPYEIIVGVTDPCGASDEDTIVVNVSFGAYANIDCPAEPIDVHLCQVDQVCQTLDITPLSANVITSFGTYTNGELCFEADTSGTYEITVTAGSDCGNDQCVLTFNVSIGEQPQITCPSAQTKFICEPGNVCIPVGVMGAGAVVTVGPIGTYSAGNLCFPADTSGHYEITMTATTDCGTANCTVVVDVTIDNNPVATDPTTPVDTFICAPTTICYQFAASDVDGGTLTWTRLTGNGTVTSDGLWCFDVSATGTKTVTVVAADACGKADTTTLTYNVTLNSAPIVAFAKGVPVTFLCDPEEICLNYSASDADDNIMLEELTSAVGSIDTVANKICFTPSTAGSYQFEVVVTDACGAKDTATYQVNVAFNSPPVVDAGADQTIFQCTKQQICWPVTASDPDDNLATVELINSPGTYDGTNICFMPTGTLNYEFVLKATDDCGAVSYDTVVIYYTLDTAPVANAGADQTLFLCAPEQICWPASCTDADGNLSSAALISGPGTYDGSNICFTPTASGTYTFVLEATDACGATHQDEAVINVTINSDPVCVVPNDTTIFQCTPAQVCLPAYATDSDDNLTSCQILSGPGTLVNGTWCYTPASSQTVTVVVQCEDACGAVCQSQFTVEFEVNEEPTITFGADQTVSLCASSEICLPFTAADPNDPRNTTISLVSGPGTLDLVNSQVCFTPTASGSYEFVVHIEDECGEFDEDTINVDVSLNTPPVADAGADQILFLCDSVSTICWPASCSDIDGNLADCLFNGPGTYDGTQICFNPVVSGVYLFTLRAEDDCGAVSRDTVKITVTIDSKPVVDLGSDQSVFLCQSQQICLPYTVDDADGLSKIHETMVSGYGTIDTAANTICFTPTSAGDYEIVVQATDSCGMSNQDTVVVSVTFGQSASIDCPTAPFDVFLCQADQICQMLDITPSSATVTVSYGTYSGGELCFEADTAGTYVIDVTADSDCGSDNCQLVFDVTIGDAPQISCPAPSTKFICEPGSVCIPVGVVGGGAVVTVSPIGSYNGGNLCFPADTSGHYELQLTATTDCGTDNCTVVVDVTIDSNPIAVDPTSPVDTFLCSPAEICYQFEADDIDGGQLTWTRLSGAGSVTGEGLWCFTPTTSGSYSVTVVVGDECGKKDTTTITYNVGVNSPPTIALAKTPPAMFLCEPEEICQAYSVADPDDNIELEELVSGAGTLDTALNQLCFTPDTAGTYSFMIRVTDSCGASATTPYSVTITFNAPPVASAGADQSIYQCAPQPICWTAGCADPDDNVDSCYVLGTVGSFSSSQICFTPDTAGAYTFVIRAVDECGEADQDTVVVTVDLNSPPMCQLPNDTTFRQCAPSPVSLPVGAVDPDDNLDHCELLRGPGSIANGEWSYTPTQDQTVKVVVMCVDDCGATCTDSFSVTFQINAPPVVNLGADTSVFLCGTATICLNVNASDEDGNLMTVEEVSPYGTYDAGTGEYCLNALYGADRSYNVVMKATDSCGAVDLDTVKVNVDFNSPPVVDLPPDFVAYLDQVGELCFDATITDSEDNVTSVTVSPIGTYNENTGQVCFDADTTGSYCLAVTAVDACGQQTTENVCIEVQVDECIHVQIEDVHNALQGHLNNVDIYLNGSGKQLGGFSFLIAYDGSALTAVNVSPGQLLEACGWEYFTYRYGADGNCSSGCPSGMLSIVGIAETNNGAYHPGCFFDGMVGSLATMTFMTSNDRLLECQYVPIDFFWLKCTDNTFSSKAGDTMWVSRTVHDHELNNLTDNSYGFPGYFGAPDVCLEGGGVDKPQPIRCVDYTGGGIKIICSDDIDDRGDINMNGLAYEISDAVMFTNYFVHGLSAFGAGMQVEGSIAASDVNIDGVPLTVADLVFLIRVVVGDSDPIAKPSPNTEYQAEFSVSSGTLKVLKSDADIGAIYVVLEGNVHPSLDENARNMDLEYNFDGENTRVLIYNHNASAVIETGAILKLNDARRVKTIEVGSSDGYIMAARLNTLPQEYSLLQNYPNPFNPFTNIEFALPEAGEWKLVVYNILGQVVESWKDRSEAGYYKVEWDASRYASGVYFYRLTAGEFSATRKMVLLK